MRPHALRVTAFGPFAGTVAVDLDALSANGLFLLRGQTGAGKTSLLDGLGFALFGRVPGVRNDAKRLRSDHAAEGVRTEVQLEVTLSGRRLRITRSPQQDRAKTRGTGTTTEQAKVLLEEQLSGAWSTVSTRVGEADAEIADLVGMSAEQFFQVVLLPQGDFAQFLRAPSAKRAEVLQKLFATERFADAEAWLAQLRRTTSEGLAAARVALSRIAARLGEVGGSEVPEDGWSTWATRLVEVADVERADRDRDVVAATLVREDARAVAASAVDLASRQERRAAALRRSAELEAGATERAALQTELDAAARAASVAPALLAARQRRATRDGDLRSAAVARAALPAVGLDPDGDPVGLRSAAEQGRTRAGLLEGLRTVELSRRTALAEVAAAQGERADALTEVTATQLLLAQVPAQRAGVQAQLETAREAAATIPTVKARQEAFLTVRPDLLGLAALTPRIGDLEQRRLAAGQEALSLGVKAHELRTASINSMVARLASALEHDTPCPVCGSLAHPDLSELLDEGVSADDEERARQAAERAQQVVAELDADLAGLRARQDELATRTSGRNLGAVDDELTRLDLDLALATGQAARQDRLAAELVGVDAQREVAIGREVAAASRSEAAQRREQEAQVRADQSRATLAVALAGAANLDAALAGVAELVSVAEVALQADEQLAAAQVELDRASAQAESACAAAGLAGPVEAAVAAREQVWHDAAAAELRAAADTAAAVADALADPALDVDLSQPAPVTQAGAAVTQADAALETVLADQARAAQRVAALARLLPELDAELAALVPLEERAREVRGLADLCAGQGANGLKMTLTAFVLAARLEEVAAVASTRLLRMTQGRYSLVHTDGAARGGSRSGLGLLARDGWSGQDRDTATLSGGETFLASLALALGLADVVTAEAGGSRIGALFVDEGFGTLDEDALDEVMDVLDGLREGGRVVGLVSHVAELRQRIPAQVEVRKTRAGSDVVLHGC